MKNLAQIKSFRFSSLNTVFQLQFGATITVKGLDINYNLKQMPCIPHTNKNEKQESFLLYSFYRYLRFEL